MPVQPWQELNTRTAEVAAGGGEGFVAVIFLFFFSPPPGHDSVC